jgi:hypothetical protein
MKLVNQSGHEIVGLTASAVAAESSSHLTSVESVRRGVESPVR